MTSMAATADENGTTGGEVVEFKPTPNLPDSLRELKRKSLHTRTTADLVDDLVMQSSLADDPKFIRLISAGVNAEAVEGTLRDDDTIAATMIRDAAPDGSPLKDENLAALRFALGVVLRRFGASRSDRRKMLGIEGQ